MGKINTPKTNNKFIYLILICCTMLLSCKQQKVEGAYFGNGMHNGWADQK